MDSIGGKIAMNTEKKLYQWDTGQKLTGCTGLYVDFPIDNEVYRVETADGMCIIPDELLQTSGSHKVYECMTNNTIRSFAFSVTPRPKPPDYVYTPTERLTFEGLVQKVDDAVADMIRRAESGEFDGHTPVKGTDYFTTAEIQQIQNEVSSGAIGEFKSVVDTETETFNTNAETKLNAYNQNDSQKTNAYNSNATEKLNAYNSNANNRVAEFDSHTEQIQTDISELKSDLDAFIKQGKLFVRFKSFDNYKERRNTNGELVDDAKSCITKTPYNFKEGEVINIKSGYVICLTRVDGSYFGNWTSDSYTITKDETLYIEVRNSSLTNLTEEQVADMPNVLTIEEDYLIATDVIKYISPDGNDTYDGSVLRPYKTLQKAIDEGATSVYATNGIYESGLITLSNRNKFNLFVLNDSPPNETDHKPKMIIDNSIELAMGEDSESGLLKGSYTAPNDSQWYKVFVDNTLSVVRSGLQSESYHAILWECVADDETLDVKLKPVLTLAECQSEQGTFFYDGNGNVYVNKKNADKTTTYKRLRNETGIMFAIQNVKNICIEDVVIKYAPEHGLQLNSCYNAIIRECSFSHTAYRDGLYLLGSNCDVIECNAYKCTGDGFGIALRGQGNFYSCRGHHNYDDGISHHDGSTGEIVGGIYEYNGKGGVASPYSNARVDVSNVISRNNAFGIYAGFGEDECSIVSCYFANNRYAIYNGGYTLDFLNCYFTDNTMKTTGNGNNVFINGQP